MKVKTSELSGAALNWAVAKAEGLRLEIIDGEAMNITERGSIFHHVRFTGFWDICGPLIEKYNVSVSDCDGEWVASIMNDDGSDYAGLANGGTPLIAICRAVVASVLGDEIDLPEGLQ